jgi:hypothetical protein
MVRATIMSGLIGLNSKKKKEKKKRKREGATKYEEIYICNLANKHALLS